MGHTARRLLALLAVVALFATSCSFFDADDERNRSTSTDATTDAGIPPHLGDHWHAAYGIYVCDRFLPSIADENDPEGIHTHRLDGGRNGDGVIHVHPFFQSSSGKNATLGKFADAVDSKLSETSITLPDGTSYENGDECDGEEAAVSLLVNGESYRGDPNDLRFEDRQLITIAFAAPGAAIPEPPSAAQLDNLSDLPQS